MKFLLNIKNYYYTFFLFFFILVGIFYSLQAGITHDEQYDLYVWQANKNVIINTFLGKNLDTSFLSGGSEFYGSGFHILSYPIENLIKFFSILPDHYDNETKTLLSKHASVFIFFALSGIIFRKILMILTKDALSSNLASIFYLLSPYLLGHSFFNIKDIPFLSIWLICTYLFIKIENNFYKKNILSSKHLFFIKFFYSLSFLNQNKWCFNFCSILSFFFNAI